MGVKWREFEIRFTDPGCTILQEAKSYGTTCVYRRQFKSLYDGLNFIVDKVGFTEASDIQEAMVVMNRIKNDLKIACSRLEAEPKPEPAVSQPRIKKIIKKKAA